MNRLIRVLFVPGGGFSCLPVMPVGAWVWRLGVKFQREMFVRK